ncbi:hypothetical protein SAMN05421881_11291 [Nitrosomonas halophila]|uniref:Transposase n=1 Tax=Nitrosomonas halophila TaxID=44576 RepID=A0A1H3Q3N1_9PROT|nr:hypothetical protein SAMN05421881_11291 [Nitrosomonas halophila]
MANYPIYFKLWVLVINHKQRDYAHIVVMPHAHRNILDEFLMDLEQDQTITA